MSTLSDDDKISNLWKKSRGVIDNNKPLAFQAVEQRPKIYNVNNEDIFNQTVPNEIPGAIVNLQTAYGYPIPIEISENSVYALDAKFSSQSVIPGGVPSGTPQSKISTEIGNGHQGYKLTDAVDTLTNTSYDYLTFYYRIPLISNTFSNTTSTGSNGVFTTYFLPPDPLADPNPSKSPFSAIRNTIAFNFGGRQHYFQQFYVSDGPPSYSNMIPIEQNTAPEYLIFENQSGYCLIYGKQDDAPNWILTSGKTLHVSLIRYEGRTGVGGGISSGDDISFNNLDICGNLTLGGDLILKGHNLLNRSDFTFYNTSTTNDIPPFTDDSTLAGSTPAGYYLIAEVDDLLDIYDSTHPERPQGKRNFSQLLVAGNFKFLARPNLDDQGFNSGNRLGYQMETLIGINQHYQNALFNDEVFHNTKYCIIQSSGGGSPFKSLHVFRDSTALKYKLYIYVDNFANKNKIIDFSVLLTDNGENMNPIPTNIDKDLELVLNWDLTNIIHVASPPPGTEMFTLPINNNGNLKWAGTNLPYLGTNSVSVFGNNILNRYTYGDNGNDFFDNDSSFIAEVNAGDGNSNNYKEILVNGDFRLLAKYEVPSTGETYAQEVMFRAGVQCSGSSTRNQNSYIHVIQNTISHDGYPLLNNIYLRSDAGVGYYFFYITVERNTSLTTRIYLDIQITNNNENSFASSGITTARHWGINRDTGGTGLTSYIRRVNISNSSFSAYNNNAVLANKFGTGGGDGGNCFITEDTDVIDSSIQTNIAADGNSNLINKLNDGGMVIDAKTSDSTGGGLKIFNSGGTFSTGNLARPQISLIPYINSTAGTLGAPTILSVNDDDSTWLKGSGSLSLYSGDKNFGTFNVYQGTSTLSTASNVIHTEDKGNNEYQLSFNHSRNDTDVIINTPNYSILNMDPNFVPDPNPAMIADSGTDTITFNAPVIFNNDVTSDTIALVKQHTFHTANISPDDWFTLAQVGDGSDRNKLRADAKFVLEDRLGSHHHVIIFKAGVKFSSGIYIHVLQSSWFSTPRIQALRIAYNSTYDGAVLQAQLNSDSGSQSNSNLTLRIYQNRNNPGWISYISGSPSATNNPTCYVPLNSSNGFGTAYPNFRNSGNIIHDANGRNTTQTTTSNFIINQSRFLVENSSGVNIETNQSPGNIVLDTIGNTAPPSGATRGISLASHEGMLIQCNNNSAVSDPGVFAVNGNTWYFNSGGFNMNGKNVDNADTIQAQTFTRRDNTTAYKEIIFGTYDIVNKKTKTRFLEPIILKNNTNPNDSKTYLNNLSSNTDEGSIIYARPRQSPSDNTEALFNEFIFGGGKRTPVYLTPPTIKKMSSSLISGSKSHPYSVTTSSPVYISGAEDMSQFSVDSAWNNTGLAIHWIPGCNGFLDRIVMNPYRSRVRITSGSGSKVIQFETWIINSNRGYSNMANNTVTEYAVQFANHTYTTTSTNVQYRSYPFNDGSAQSRVYKTTQKLKILEGETYSLYCVIRLASGPSITCTFSNSQAGSGTSWPNSAIPMTFDLYCHLHCEL